MGDRTTEPATTVRSVHDVEMPSLDMLDIDAGQDTARRNFEDRWPTPGSSGERSVT